MATRTFKRIGGEATVETKVNLGALERSLNGKADNSEDEGGEGRARDEGAAPPYKLGRYEVEGTEADHWCHNGGRYP